MKKLMIGGIVAAALLASPTVAGANHVPGATYQGTVSTGQGGSVTAVVSDDGSTVNVSFDGLGNVSGTCTGVGFDTGDIPIAGHSFSYSANAGQVTANGTFDAPGSVGGGAQVLTTPCTTGSQAWSATTPVVGVDASVARSTDPFTIGNGIYNLTAVGQTKKWTAKRGQARVFDFVFRNSGTEDGEVGVRGCGSSKGFKVRYTLGGVNVTNQVVNGTLSEFLIAGDVYDLRTQIKPTKAAKIGKTKMCKATGITDVNRDVIKAEVKVKRG